MAPTNEIPEGTLERIDPENELATPMMSSSGEEERPLEENVESAAVELQDGDEGDEENCTSQSCPVCLTSCSNLVSGPCRHSFCLPCMKRVLNADASVVRWPPQSVHDNHLSAPTLGRCPICRGELSLFQIVPANGDAGGNLLYPPFTEYHLQKNCPLRNQVYVPYRGRVGQLSFHWDWCKIKNKDVSLPFFNISETVKRNPENWRLESGKLAPSIIYFEKGCHFHPESRTFHGKILWPDRLNGSYHWDIVLGFPSNYRFLSTGRIHMRRELRKRDEELPAVYTLDEKQLCGYPFDGRWTVHWKNKQGEEEHTEIHVKNNEFKQSGWSFFLNFEDPIHPRVRWPKSKHFQTVQEGVNLAKQPMGPKVGDRIRWTSTSPKFPELFWTRQTVGPVPVPRVISFGMGEDKVLYQRLNAKTDDSIPKYYEDSLWGNVFCKRLYVGSASYHFLSPSNCYVSYQHPACRDLPPLDDGSPMPTRVDLHDVEFIQQERKLTATVEWEKDFGTSWNDNIRWKLTMYFDSEYMVILRGGIQCEWCRERRARPRPPRQPNPNRPTPVPIYVPPKPETPGKPAPSAERNEEWVMSGYGHDQLYINAAMIERYRHESLSVDYKAISETQCERLKREGATKRSIDYVAHVFSLVADKPHSNPIDFLL